ncbi:unnamed protein product [Didymodactylos carnosus]|uniref:Uncharacterized protein n=1 Tax=Didymodactylos carnosus TaxID=1234261 RepID=A0A814ETB8_9BILA|nr:unnamed protein product [Didymodactylos carnosus]CAF1009050.1 unnamed protein product [Didymodactylos carnosus]CAF3746625.1 unnamed protein product [Didymodactylos carnosus]CAF3777974.1 unnamed protein product [Didymodactylos carnosus]
MNDPRFSEEDYISWTGWTKEQLIDMAEIIEPVMNESKHRSVFNAICIFWIKMKTNLSFRQIGTLFRVDCPDQDIRKRVSDSFHSVAAAFEKVIVPQHLGIEHLTREMALSHQTAYTKAFYGDNICLIWDGIYFYFDKSDDHELQRHMYSGQKKYHLLKFM